MRKLGQLGAATLSTLMLIFAVVKGQGCQRQPAEPVAEPATTRSAPAPDLGASNAVDAEDHADVSPKVPAVMPATKSGLFLQGADDGVELMGATKSAGFVPSGGWGGSGLGKEPSKGSKGWDQVGLRQAPRDMGAADDAGADE